MALAFSEIYKKYVILVHVSFFAGIAQEQMKQLHDLGKLP